MSRAFDTINRERLMKILKDDVELDEDELRLCQALLAGTNLTVKIKTVFSAPFETTIGTPQGDGLSPILFVVYLESAIREVMKRAELKNIIRPKIDEGLPDKAIYADDSDFISTSECYLKGLEDLIPPTILEWDLMANPGKWERTKINGEEEEWKKVRKLGSLLGDEEDLERRMGLASVQFKLLSKLWEKGGKTTLDTRMRVYNAFVIPILTYNASTCTLTEANVEGIYAL